MLAGVGSRCNILLRPGVHRPPKSQDSPRRRWDSVHGGRRAVWGRYVSLAQGWSRVTQDLLRTGSGETRKVEVEF